MQKSLPNGDPMLFAGNYAAHLQLRPAQVARHPDWPAMDATLEAMAELGKGTGVRVVVCLLPSKSEIYSWVLVDAAPFSAPARTTAGVAVLAQHALDAGLEVHDLTSPVWEAARAAWQEKELLWWRDDTHPNPRGHEVLAGLLDGVVRR